jgi:hypothetical protein
MGFIVRSGLRQDPVGSYPAFSPLPRTILGIDQTRLRPTYGQNGTGRYIFWDTFRYPGIASRVPSFSRGMPPYGVRTFLWQIVKTRQRSPATSRRLPQLIATRQGVPGAGFGVPSSKFEVQSSSSRTISTFEPATSTFELETSNPEPGTLNFEPGDSHNSHETAKTCASLLVPFSVSPGKTALRKNLLRGVGKLI